VRFNALHISPAKIPSRTLGTIHTTAVRNGLTLKRVVPTMLGVPSTFAALANAVRPNTNPKAAPPEGPSITAPIATGIMLTVIASGPIGI